MNFNPVSLESTPFVPAHVTSHSALKLKDGHGTDSCVSAERRTSDSPLRQLLIQKALGRIADHGLFGHEHVSQYLMDLYRRNCRANTIRARFASIFMFLQYLKAQGRHLLDLVGREDICAFIEQEQDRGLKPSSVSGRVDGVYAFIRFLVDQEVLSPDLLKRKLRVKLPDSLPRAIDPDDVRRLLAVIRRPRDRAMVLILLRTGMRIGELLNTTLTDVNLTEKRIEIFETQKNRVGRVVYLAEDACRALQRWLEVRPRKTALLFSGHRGHPLSYERARANFKTLLVKAELAHKGYTLHCLRHTFASELLNAGMRLECLQQLLGHSSIEMTRRYARLTDITRKEEYFRAMAKIEKEGLHGDY
jgi:site-specific recombinase XerD